MNDLAMALVRLCKHNRDGAFATQSNRRRGLVAAANDLYALGYKLPRATSIKPKHVTALTEHWRAQGLSPGTLKNRLGWLRWWAEKVNKVSILPRGNAALGIPNRTAANHNRAWSDAPALPNRRHQAAVDLMRTFGLRLEEALKLRVAQADRGHTLHLQGSWTKGGRARAIPIDSEEARTVLNHVHDLTGGAALIPAGMSYIQFRQQFETALARAKVRNVHGLRHGWAQRRYQHLTGWACLRAGGPVRADLSTAQLRADRQARQQIAAELGHGRISITTVYLG